MICFSHIQKALISHKYEYEPKDQYEKVFTFEMDLDMT